MLPFASGVYRIFLPWQVSLFCISLNLIPFTSSRT